MAWQATGAALAEVPEDKAHIVTVGGKQVGLVREGDRVHAVLNFCPHFGAPVCEGKVFAGCVTGGAPPNCGEDRPLQGFDASRLILRCPWHHWEFDVKTGAALAPIRQRLKTYRVKVEGDGQVWVDV
jgi:nitrite reductase/ring-hydroxylating ferredoxin subunit